MRILLITWWHFKMVLPTSNVEGGSGSALHKHSSPLPRTPMLRRRHLQRKTTDPRRNSIREAVWLRLQLQRRPAKRRMVLTQARALQIRHRPVQVAVRVVLHRLLMLVDTEARRLLAGPELELLLGQGARVVAGRAPLLEDVPLRSSS